MYAHEFIITINNSLVNALFWLITKGWIISEEDGDDDEEEVLERTSGFITCTTPFPKPAKTE